MTYHVRFTEEAQADLLRLYDFLLQRDIDLAEQALSAMHQGLTLLETFPFACRKAQPKAIKGQSRFSPSSRR